MKFTLSDCMSRINQALNYPSLTYEDVSHFFDQAISELNTSLRIALPTVTEMRFENTFNILNSPNLIKVKILPITTVSSPPTEAPSASGSNIVYYYNKGSLLDNAIYIFKNGAWKAVEKAYGLAPSGTLYETHVLDDEAGFVKISDPVRFREFSLTEYLPTDWIILFLIPYVCFKFSVRSGDNGALFSDEFTQGFQQLQTSYNVPNDVILSTVAHLPAYHTIAASNLSNLNITVTTRAITEDMRVRNGISKVYGDNVFDAGGWGI